MAHAMETGWKDMKEKSANELVRMKVHDLPAIASIAPIIPPSEGDMIVIDLEYAAVGDGDAVRVSAEIGKHLTRAPEWRFCIDDPFDAASPREMVGECLVVVEMRQFVEEAQLTLRKGVLESGQKEPSEQTRQNPNRQEKAWPACYPS